MATNIVTMVLGLKDKASGPLKKVGKQASSANVSAKGLAVGFAAVAGAAVAMGAALYAAGKNVSDMINKLTDMSAATGLSVGTLQDLQLMARTTGGDIDGLERGMIKFSVAVGDAKRGVKESADAFAALGIDPEQFADQDEALLATIERLQSMEDISERNAIAQKLFGGAAKKMLKAMQKDIGNASKAHELLGISMGDNAEMASRMQTEMGLFSQMMDQFKADAWNSFAGEDGMAGGLATVAGLMMAVMDLMRSMLNVVVGFFGTIGYSVRALYALAAREPAKAREEMQEGKKMADKFAESLESIFTGEWAEKGAEYSDQFERASSLMNKTAAEGAGVMGELDDGVTGVGNSLTDAERALQQFREGVDELNRSGRTLIDLDSWGRVPGLLTELGVAGLGLEGKDKRLAIAHEVVSIYSDALGEAQSLLESSGQFQHRREQLADMLMDVIYEVRLGPGPSRPEDIKITESDLSRMYTELKALTREAEAFMGADQSRFFYDQEYMQIDALERARNVYRDNKQAAAELLKLDDKKLVSAQQYRAEISKQTREVEDALEMQRALAGEIYRLIEIQTQYSGAEGKGRVLIAKEFGFEAADRFGDDVDAAFTHAIGELQDAMKRPDFTILSGVESIEGLDLELKSITAQQAKIEAVEIAGAKIQELGGVLGAAAGGEVFGALGGGLTATGNPYAIAAGAAVDALGQVAELGELARDSSVKQVSEDIVASAEETVENFKVGLDVLREILPELVTIVAMELPVAIIKSLPQLKLAFQEAMVGALTYVFGWLYAAVQRIVDFFTGGREGRRESVQSVKDYWSNRWDEFATSVTGMFREGESSFAMGTPFVGRTGLAMLHKGESVVPVGGRAQQGAQGLGSPININISASVIDRDVIPRLVREIERATSKYGRMRATFA